MYLSDKYLLSIGKDFPVTATYYFLILIFLLGSSIKDVMPLYLANI